MASNLSREFDHENIEQVDQQLLAELLAAEAREAERKAQPQVEEVPVEPLSDKELALFRASLAEARQTLQDFLLVEDRLKKNYDLWTKLPLPRLRAKKVEQITRKLAVTFGDETTGERPATITVGVNFMKDDALEELGKYFSIPFKNQGWRSPLPQVDTMSQIASETEHQVIWLSLTVGEQRMSTHTSVRIPPVEIADMLVPQVESWRATGKHSQLENYRTPRGYMEMVQKDLASIANVLQILRTQTDSTK
jgi:hypothetical protein